MAKAGIHHHRGQDQAAQLRVGDTLGPNLLGLTRNFCQDLLRQSQNLDNLLAAQVRFTHALYSSLAAPLARVQEMVLQVLDDA